MAACHTIITQEQDGVISYNASSPDELALVNAARFFGYYFKGRDEESNIVIEKKNVVDPTEETQIIKIELLEVIEFDSTRKRMTSIVRMPDGKIKVLMKGADSIIVKRLADPNDPLVEVTNGFL